MAFVKAVGLLSTAPVNRAMTRMIDIDILVKSGKEIRFANPFFKAWRFPRGRQAFPDSSPGAADFGFFPGPGKDNLVRGTCYCLHDPA
jgi:hypothetical protein